MLHGVQDRVFHIRESNGLTIADPYLTRSVRGLQSSPVDVNSPPNGIQRPQVDFQFPGQIEQHLVDRDIPLPCGRATSEFRP